MALCVDWAGLFLSFGLPQGARSSRVLTWGPNALIGPHSHAWSRGWDAGTAVPSRTLSMQSFIWAFHIVLDIFQKEKRETCKSRYVTFGAFCRS